MSQSLQVLSRRSTDGGARTHVPCGDPMSIIQRPVTAYEAHLAKGPDNTTVGRQLRRLVDRLLHDFPPETGGTVLLSAISNDSLAADVGGMLASELSGRQATRVTLLDADLTSRTLTRRFAALNEPGFSDALEDKMIGSMPRLATSLERVHFVSAGTSTISDRNLRWEAVQASLAELAGGSAYVLVVTGASQTETTRALARYCDGTYLIAPVGQADRSETSEWVRPLSAGSARIMGCIATHPVGAPGLNRPSASRSSRSTRRSGRRPLRKSSR